MKQLSVVRLSGAVGVPSEPVELTRWGVTVGWFIPVNWRGLAQDEDGVSIDVHDDRGAVAEPEQSARSKTAAEDK